jgi:outer membrane receptor protein involved in Fe transport
MKPAVGVLSALVGVAAFQAQAQQSAPPPAKTAGDVVVTARTPAAQTRLDRKVYDVSRDLQSTTGTAADVLNNVPSVSVDADGVVSIRGDANVTILVDGKPSAAYTGAAAGLSLQQLPASEIDRIEVLTSPPAQYKASGSGGVINIVTRKPRRAGPSATLSASVGDHGRYVLNATGAINGGRLRLSGGAGLRRDIRERLTTTERLAIDPSTGLPAQSAERIDEHFHRLTPSGKADLDYELDARQSIGASFDESVLTGHRWFDQQNESGPPAAPPTSVSTRHSDGHEWHLEGGEGVHFDQKLGRPGETLSLALNRSITDEQEGYAYANSFLAPPAPQSFDDLHLGMSLEKFEFSADYDLPMAHERDLKLGYDLEADDNSFDNVGHVVDPVTGQPVIDPDVTYDYRYRQQVHAAYAQYQALWGSLTAQAGLRLEASHASWLLITGNIPGRRSDLGLYPSLHLDRTLGRDGKLSLSISRRINRPDPETLNPFIDHQDTHNLRAGNPDLKPQDTWLAELGTTWTPKAGSYTATAYVREDRNSFTDVLKPVAADVVLATRANLPLTRSAGVEFSAYGKLWRVLSYGVSGNYFWSQIDATALGFPGLRATSGVNLKATVDFKPTARDDLQASFSRTDRRLTPQGSLSPINLLNLGYRRQLRPDLAFIATVSDVLNGQRLRRTTTAPDLTQVYQRYQLGRIIYFGFTYSFGALPKKGGGFEYDP